MGFVMTFSCVSKLYLDHIHPDPLLSSCHFQSSLLSSASALSPCVGRSVWIWVLFADHGFN